MRLRTFSAILAVILFLGYGFLNGLDPRQLINFQSLMIVIGGIVLVLWFGFPTEEIRLAWNAVLTAFRERTDEKEEGSLLCDVLRLARVYRMHGPMALEKAVKGVKNEYLRYGATLVAEGYNRMELYTAMEREHRILRSKDMGHIRILRTLARLSPALGMAGTVISLMKVMQELGNMESLGGSLGLALSSTLYGIMLANLLFLPVMLKLEQSAEKRSAQRIMLTEAVLGLQQGEHPLRIAERLNSFDIYCRINAKEKALQTSGEKGTLQQVSAG